MVEKKFLEEIQLELKLTGIQLKDAILHNVKTYCLMQANLSQESVKGFYKGIVSFIDAISLIGLHFDSLKK